MRRLVLLFSVLLLTGQFIFSQDCNSFFQNATNEARKQNISSLQTAVKLYESAKRCYNLVNNGTGARMCDERISECSAAITRLAARRAQALPTDDYYIQDFTNQDYVAFEVSTDNIDFTAKGGKETVSITGNTVWAVPSLRGGWFRVVKNGEEIDVIAEENKTSETRAGYFSIQYSSANRQKMIRISQEGVEPRISLSERNIVFQPDANWERKISVSSNADWTVADAPYWCQAVRVDDKLVLTPQVNDEDEIRTGTIIIAAGQKKEIIEIKQESNSLKVSPAAYTFAKVGGRAEFRVIYSGMASSHFDVVNMTADWCKVTKPDNNRIIIQCLPNKKNAARAETILVKMGTQEVTIAIEQEGKK